MAKRVYPQSPEAYAFMVECAVDAAIYGGIVTRVDPNELYGHAPMMKDFARIFKKEEVN